MLQCAVIVFLCFAIKLYAFQASLFFPQSTLIRIPQTNHDISIIKYCINTINKERCRQSDHQLYMAPPAKPPATPSAGSTPDKSSKKKVKDDVIQVNGKVVEALPNAMFRVEIEPSKQVILATISGRIRKNFVRVIVGDSVQVELSAYDLTRGRITFRNK